MQTTFEKASRCPKCELPGTPSGVVPGEGRSKVHTFRCDNERCKWFETGWIVQVNADGSIPERKPGPKQFNLLQNPMAGQVGRDILRQAVEEDPTLAKYLGHIGV